MNIKDTYIHEGPGGKNAKALLKDFSITSTLIVLTRAKLTADGSADETDTPITIPTWNLSTTGNAATASALSVIKSTAATAHYLTFVDSNNDSAANENFYTTANISIVPSTGTLTLTNTTAPALIINNTNSATNHDCGILFLRSGTAKGWAGYRADHGIYLYNSTRLKYLEYKDNGTLLFETNKVWHAGNDGPDSGLNADLLDGQHLSDLDARYVLISGDTMTGALVVPSLSVTGTATFSQTINGSILGNAATASRLQNARTIALTGSVTGSGTFDGSGNLSIATTTNHTHQYVNTIGKSGSTITWAINGTAQTALDFSTTFAPYNADGYLPLTGGTLTATKAWASAVLTVNNNLDATWVTTTNFLTPNLTAAHYNCIMVGHDTTTNNNAGHLSFYYAGSGSANNRMALAFLNNVDILVVRADRKVGICTTAPTHVLHTVGDTYSSTYIEAGTYLKSGSYMQATTYVRASGNDLYIGSASGSQCHQQYDNTNKVLKFIFD